MPSAVRCVFDCNTLLQALARPSGPAGKCVELALRGEVSLFLSPFVIAELRDVAARPKVATRLKLEPIRVAEFIAALEIAAAVLENFPTLFSYERDPDDAHYVNLALAAGARLIVSRDDDLLDLMKEKALVAEEFRRRFPALRILNPVAFLRELGVQALR